MQVWTRLILILFLNLREGSSQKPTFNNKRHDVYIAGFFPFAKGVPESRTGRGVMPAVKLAVDHINDSPNVLRNFRLHMWWNDTQCNAAVGVKAFFDMMDKGPRKVMLFGTACTQVTDPIAKASKHWHLTQVSYADTDPMFTSSNFPNFFRVVPSENAFNAPRIKLMQHFNWTRVGTIYQNEPRYSLAHNRLVADLDTIGYEVVETQSLATNVSIAIQKLQEKDTRIILGNFNESWARQIFCEAYRVGMYGRKYQWLIMGTYEEEWWLEDSPCNPEELAAALDGTILTDYLPLASTRSITVAGITPEEYQEEYNNRRGSEYSRFHGYTYDGIWAVALAIQNVAHRIRHVKKNCTIVDFRYRDEFWERLFLEALRNTSFEGVTGAVRFYDNERKASILLKQFQSRYEIKIGEYNGILSQLDFSEDSPIRWKGRSPPKDRTLILYEHSHVNYGIYVFLVVLSVLGIILATAFLITNIKFRNQRYIKMSSPYLNNLIIIGCMLTYISVIFLGLDSNLTSEGTFPYICTARAWFLMAGFSLAFGAMFSKTWRVHSIFTDVKLNKKVIKDFQLFMVVGILLVVDLGIMTTWHITDPFYRKTKEMESYTQHGIDDVYIIPVNEYCQSDNITWFIGSIYAWKGLLMVFGAFLAWETRHVSIPALNDSKYVGMSVYNVVLMCILGAAVSLVLSDRQDVSFVIIASFILFCATTTLCLVFVPKVVELRRNPQGRIDKRMMRATIRPTSKRRESSEMEQSLKEAKAENQKYRKLIQEKECELQLLSRRLNAQESIHLMTDITALRKEVPSATETTELSSGYSATSFCENELSEITSNTIQHSKKKPVFPNEKTTAAPGDDTLSVIKENESASSSSSPPTTDNTPVNVEHNSPENKKNHSSSEGSCSAPTRRKVNQTSTTNCDPIYNCSNERRPSIPAAKRNTPAFVHQDELWLTQRQYKSRCVVNGNTTPSDDDNNELSIIQRSVSEKSRDKCNHQYHHHNHRHHNHYHHTIATTSSSSSNIMNNNANQTLKKPTATYVQSTPDVLNASVSENELLDLAILPIFQKLLTERRGVAMASCPNIAIKCDIVEYL